MKTKIYISGPRMGTNNSMNGVIMPTKQSAKSKLKMHKMKNGKMMADKDMKPAKKKSSKKISKKKKMGY